MSQNILNEAIFKKWTFYFILHTCVFLLKNIKVSLWGKSSILHMQKNCWRYLQHMQINKTIILKLLYAVL